MSNDPNALPNPFDIIHKNDSPDMELISREVDETNDKNLLNLPPFFSILYHNISLEIPQKFTLIVNLTFYSTYSIYLSLIINFIGSFFSNNINHSTFSSLGREIVLSFFNLIFFSFFLFVFQYYPIYLSIKDEKYLKTVIPVQILTIFLLIIFFLGFLNTGIIGYNYWIISIECGQTINLVFSFILTLWHFLNLILEIIILILIYPIFKNQNRISNPSDL